MASRLSTSSEESFWNGQKDHLKRIREILQDHDDISGRSTPVINKYRKTRPSHLRKFNNGSPKHDSPTSLRCNKYNVVPPLRLKHQKPTDGSDSWGDEDSDTDDDDDEDEHKYRVVQYHNYPVVMYPMLIPMQPQPTKQKKTRKKVSYRNTPIYLIRGGDSVKQESAKHRPDRDPFDSTSNPILAKYLPNSSTKNIFAQSQNLLRDFSRDVDAENRFVNRLVEEFLDEELIPDLLIDFYRDEEARTTPQLKYIHDYDYNSCHKIDKKRNAENRTIARNKKSYGNVPLKVSTDQLKSFLDDLVDEVIYEESHVITRLSSKEMANAYVEKMVVYDIIKDLATEEILETGDFIVDEALLEIALEDIVDEMVLQPELIKQSHEVAIETVQQNGNKRRKKDIQQIERSVGEKIREEICLDYLLKLTVRQGQLWTKEQYANKFLDDMILSILIGQYADVKKRRKATIENKPVRHLYEKLFIDVALEVLLHQISQHLDEDMTDLDQYEQGMQTNLHKWLASDESTLTLSR